MKLAIVVSHPIQHFVHLYRALATRDDLSVKVFFCSSFGLTAYHDEEMATTIQWAGDMLSGYDSAFLPGADSISGTGFFELDNPGVGRALANFGPDAVLLYGYAQMTQVRALTWCLFTGVPLLMAGDGDNVRRKPGVYALVRHATLFLLFRQVSVFLTAGDQNEDMLASLGVLRARMVRTPLSIDEATYKVFAAQRDDERERIRSKHDIPDDAVVFLFVGKLSLRKRPMDLLNAWARIARADSSEKAALLFCGDGAEKTALKKAAAMARAPAIFAGFVNVDELPAYYCAADVLVHPSERDPHPLICSEASCIGLPMILSDRVGAIGPTDIAREGENTLKFSCGDIDALAAAMEWLLREPNVRQTMSHAARRIYDECDLRANVDGVARGLQLAAGPVSGAPDD